MAADFNDDPLWLILGVAAYLKETGDWSILDEPVVYENTPGTETPLYEHLQRSLQYTLDRLGPHGLPLIGRADWNDCLNLNCFSEEPGESFQTTTNKEGDTAESVFIAGQFVLAAAELAAIAQHLGHDDEAASLCARPAQRWRRRRSSMAGTAGGSCAPTTALATRSASAENEEGKIFIESQGMCIMAGIGVEDGRAVQALASVAEHLATEHGIVLLDPPYSQYYLHLGEISSYPPGYKENGSVFCHTNPWIMMAEALVGQW